MLDVELAIDAADERYRLIARAKRPLAGRGGKTLGERMVASKRKRMCVSRFGLLGVLLRIAFPAGSGADVLAGCRLQQQSGQYDTTYYQISLPLN